MISERGGDCLNGLLWLIVTLAVASVSGFIFYRLKFPAGAMVGALIGVGALNIITGCAFMPASVKILTKTVAGLFVGMSMTMEMVRNMKRLFRPVIVLVSVIFMLCLSAGFLLYRLGTLDAVTALFCVAPGGMTDMTLMTMDMGGDAAVVAVLQVLRLLSVYSISMPLARFLGKRLGGAGTSADKASAPKSQLTAAQKKRGILLAAVVACVGGAVGLGLSEILDFSVLILICSMVASAAVNIKTGKLYMPKSVRRVTQILSGALIGTSVTYGSLAKLKTVLLPAVLLCCGFVLINLVLAMLLRKVCKLDMATAVLSSAAGGATEAALVATDLDADPSVVSVLQISRMVFTTALYPILVQFVYQLIDI